MNMNRRKTWLALLAASVLLAYATGASADDGGDGLGFTLGLGLPGLSAEIGNQGAYYAAPEYYAPPPPVYYAPPPPPAYYAPPPVVYAPPAQEYYAPEPRRGPPPWAGAWRH